MSGYVVEEYSNRDEWLNSRKGIGASEVATVLGINPWKTPYALWAELCGLIPRSIKDTLAMELGRELEPVIARQYAKQTGRKIEDWGPWTVLRSVERPWLFATLDRHQMTEEYGRGALEIKATGNFNQSEWESEPPIYYQTQLQAQLFVSGYDWGTIAVMPWANPVRWFDQKRNADFLAIAIEKLEAFWARVEQREPPEVDGSEQTRDALKALYREVNPKKIITLPEAAIDWDQRISDISTEIKRLEHKKRELEAQLITSIGDAAVGLLPGGGSWSYQTVDRKGYTVEATSYRQLRRKA